MSVRGVTILNNFSVSSSETEVRNGTKSLKVRLLMLNEQHEAVDNLSCSNKWETATLQSNLEFDNFKWHPERDTFECILWLIGLFSAVMIGIFWKRELRPISLHKARLQLQFFLRIEIRKVNRVRWEPCGTLFSDGALEKPRLVVELFLTKEGKVRVAENPLFCFWKWVGGFSFPSLTSRSRKLPTTKFSLTFCLWVLYFPAFSSGSEEEVLRSSFSFPDPFTTEGLK